MSFVSEKKDDQSSRQARQLAQGYVIDDLSIRSLLPMHSLPCPYARFPSRVRIVQCSSDRMTYTLNDPRIKYYARTLLEGTLDSSSYFLSLLHARFCQALVSACFLFMLD